MNEGQHILNGIGLILWQNAEKPVNIGQKKMVICSSLIAHVIPAASKLPSTTTRPCHTQFCTQEEGAVVSVKTTFLPVGAWIVQAVVLSRLCRCVFGVLYFYNITFLSLIRS